MGAVNTLGLVVLGDGENPRTFSGRARTIISGGDLVFVSGTANPIGSGASTFKTSDVVVTLIEDSDFCNGIALNTVGSNGIVTVVRAGDFIVRSAGIVSGGQPIIPVSGGTGFLPGVVGDPNGTHDTGLNSGTHIGRAITASASGTNLYTFVSLGGTL